MEGNIIEQERSNNSNNEENINKFSDLLNGSSYKKEKQKMKEITSSFSDNTKSLEGNITSTSHIVDDISLNISDKIEEIYHHISLLFEKYYFIFNIKEDKITIKYKKDKSKEFEDLLKITEKYKAKMSELLIY